MDLHTPVKKLPSIGFVFTRRLKNLKIETLEDLLLHIPNRYLDYRIVSEISRAQVGETVTIKGRVISIKNIYTNKGKKIQIAEIEDDTGKIQAVWFNQPFLVRTIKANSHFSFSGKVDWFNRKRTLISPDYENIDLTKKTIHTGRLVPIYPETRGVSSKWIRGRIFNILENFDIDLEEFLPKEVLEKEAYPNFKEAVYSVHFPKDLKEAKIAKERLALNELLFNQLKSLLRKKEWKQIKPAWKLNIDKNILEEFEKVIPFELTKSQEKAIEEIFEDLKKDHPMNRLLEGDVGSGKTVVGAAASFATFVNGFQTVVMAPTQILAQQHYETMQKIFEKFKVRVSLITSAGIKKDLGKTDIFVGTHALIHKKVEFENVALVIIDEQHRFGVEQRAHLIQKSGKTKKAPHVLTMTATPIPRTVALTIYGDLDLSTLTELPKGRKPTTTWVVPPEKREGAYNWIKEKIQKEKIQAFVICPLIEESQVESMKQVKAATAEFEELKKIFTGLNLGLLHGRQTVKEKNQVLDFFKKGEIDILVATPVVEVGIDVPNATVILIEAAERFGLAQLHQLRGRVGRGEKKSYCLLFSESKSKSTVTRLNALTKSLSGFELAELDLKLRGPGEIFGIKQHGFPELKVASWTDSELIKKGRIIAEEALRNPKKFHKLLKIVKSHLVAPN